MWDNPLLNQFSYFNVPGWYDDTCGGSIDAVVTLSDGTALSTLNPDGTRNAQRGGWVVVGPPKYSPWMYHVVSLLDRQLDLFPDADPYRGQKTTFYRDIWPLFWMVTTYAWVSEEAFYPHGPGQVGDLLSEANLAHFLDPSDQSKPARQRIYHLLREAEIDNIKPPPAAAPPPRRAGEGPQPNPRLMPKLWGSGGKPLQNQQLGYNLPNQFLRLTTLQLARLKDWADGNFDVGTPIQRTPLADLPLSEQPRAMDFSALQPTIGGGFHPGIELTYLITYKEFFEAAFRVAASVEPGAIAAYMSCPWQGDFWSCNTAWWPVQRPDIVVFSQDGERKYQNWFRGIDPKTGAPLSSTDGYNQMVTVWPQLGMVVPTGDVDQGETAFKEIERDPALDGSKSA